MAAQFSRLPQPNAVVLRFHRVLAKYFVFREFR
jgi:hypothetical protein